jgi:hypothetical protein
MLHVFSFRMPIWQPMCKLSASEHESFALL